MDHSHALPRLRKLRAGAHVWRREAPALVKLMMAFGMAALTGVAAQVRIPLPFTPVPVTGQVFAVLLAGILLGGAYGGLSQAFYLALGAAGVPWGTGLTGGMAWLAGPTGGYLVGFVAAAVLIGRVTDRSPAARRFVPQLALLACGVAVIYLFGMAHLALNLKLGWRAAFLNGAVPFLGADALKVAAAAAVSTVLLPKQG
ncbi:MAG: biotin transporter BioY [Candidatus Brocadiia bacterium]